MIALMSFPPKACPGCGERDKTGKWNADSRSDFFAGAAQTCQSCGLHFAFAPAEQIRLLAAETGDMGRYVQVGEAE